MTITFNHTDSDSVAETLNMTEQELVSYIDDPEADRLDDLHFALVCMKESDTLLALVLSATTGLDLKRPSEVAEYLVHHIKDKETRGRITKFSMVSQLGVLGALGATEL